MTGSMWSVVVDRVRVAVVIAGALAVGCGTGVAQRSQVGWGLAEEVYPFLGADWGGNVFVGASLPFGVVKVGPDMETFDGRASHPGYWSAGKIRGFSHTHLSGAAGKYGNVLVMPTTGKLDPADIVSPREDEVDHPGFYAATLTRYKVRAEMTVSRRVAVHRYTFPASGQAHLTVDLDHCLGKGTGWEDQKFLGGSLKLVSDHEVQGVGRYTGGWNRGGEYRVYFDIVLDTPSTSEQMWVGKSLDSRREATIAEDEPFG
ncbi:MAG: glycoside hydrolase family 92 protein, partial [Acidobacteriota bacterium]